MRKLGVGSRLFRALFSDRSSGLIDSFSLPLSGKKTPMINVIRLQNLEIILTSKPLISPSLWMSLEQSEKGVCISRSVSRIYAHVSLLVFSESSQSERKRLQGPFVKDGACSPYSRFLSLTYSLSSQEPTLGRFSSRAWHFSLSPLLIS